MCPKSSSDSGPQVSAKGQGLFQEGMEERGGKQLSLHPTPVFKFGYPPICEERRRDS